MKASRVVHALGPVDLANVRRDPMLRWMVFLPLILTLAMRLALPPIAVQLDAWLSWDLISLYPPLMGYISLLLIPYLWGVLLGFVLLDQRDDRTLLALQVTPLSLEGYLRYRLFLPTLLSAVTVPLSLPLTGLVRLSPAGYLILALAAAPQAPLIAMALAALARNKVEGLALMKVANVILLPPLVAYFLPAGWQWPFLLFPTTWLARLLWELQAGGATAWAYLLGGVVYQVLLLRWLARRFGRIIVQ